MRDYSRSNRVRSRGVMISYNLADGLYEVNEPRSWGKTDRYFIHVEGGSRATIGAADVIDLLNPPAAPAKKTPKAVMARAWEIARAGAAKFGGKARDYFAASLKMAWAEA